MHFHLPKPLHGWRAFIGEVSVIVLGVAIALTAEQVVENVHWHRAVDQALAGMRADAGEQRYALIARYNQERCIKRRLADIGALFSRHDAGQPVGTINPVGRPFYNTGYAPSWDVAVADGTVAHLSFAERSSFADAFGTYQLYDRQMWEEKRVWQHLQMLNHVASFTPSDWSEARQAYDLASDFDASFQVTLPRYLGKFKIFKLPPGRHSGDPANPFRDALCRPFADA